jgi:hypothetical protein
VVGGGGLTVGRVVLVPDRRRDAVAALAVGRKLDARINHPVVRAAGEHQLHPAGSGISR